MSAPTLYMDSNGIWCRTGIVSDSYVVAESAVYDALPIGTGDVVLDVGANIGVVSRRVLDRGASFVLAVEPCSDNVDVLRMNLAHVPRSRYAVLPAAVVGGEHVSGLTELHIPESNFAMCSLVRHGAPYAKITRTTQVATVPLANLLHQYRPTVVKIDIEAGEYALLETLCALPSHVRVLAIEWHNFDPHRTDGGFLALYRSGHAALIASGFEVIYTEGQLIVQQHSAVLHVYNAVRAIAAS